MNGNTKINTDGMQFELGQMLDYLEKMKNKTVQLHQTATSHNERISDGVMGEIVALLTEIRDTISDVQKKTSKYTEKKLKGVEEIVEANNEAMRRLKR